MCVSWISAATDVDVGTRAASQPRHPPRACVRASACAFSVTTISVGVAGSVASLAPLAHLRPPRAASAVVLMAPTWPARQCSAYHSTVNGHLLATLVVLGRAAAQGRLVYLEDRPQATPQSAPLPSQSGCLSSRKHPTCAQLPGTGIGCSRCISAGRSPVSARHSFSSARVARPHCVPRVGAPTSPPACCVCRTGRTMFHGSLALVPASTSDAIVSPTGIMPSHSLQQPDHGLSAGLVCPVVAGTALQGTQSMLSIILLPCTSSRFVSWSRAAETIH